MNTEEQETPSLKDIVSAELAEVAKISLEYKQKMEEAKTQIKRDYYRRKMTKNNKEIMRLLVAANKLNDNKNVSEQSSLQQGTTEATRTENSD